MKKALAVVAVLALVVWVLSWFRNPEAVAVSGAKPWPGGLGTLDSVAPRYPAMAANAAAEELMRWGGTLPQEGPLVAFVASETARGDLTIGDAPPMPDVTAIRDLLLREPIVWPRPGGVGDIGDQETSARRGVQMTVARALVAAALVKARAGDAAAWDELRALWKLAQSLEAQPQMMVQTAALSMVRMLNAAAWKMPLPAPAWFGEVQGRDMVRPLLEAFQYQTASYWGDGGALFPNKWNADGVERDRRIALSVAEQTSCDVTIAINSHGSDLTSVWRRAFRYRAEREATANALRIRAGEPIVADSVCQGGRWSYDGTTLRFNQTIATPPPDTPMPLTLTLVKSEERRVKSEE